MQCLGDVFNAFVDVMSSDKKDYPVVPAISEFRSYGIPVEPGGIEQGLVSHMMDDHAAVAFL